MLHEKACLVCNEPNDFHDPYIVISKKLRLEMQKLILELDTFRRQGVETALTKELSPDISSGAKQS